MISQVQKEMSAKLDRYELKYVIPLEMIDSMTDFLSTYCSPDKYSLQTKSGFYRVNNLYLDSPNYRFLKNRMEGVDNRFNMRIRSYGDHSDMPWFMEIKQKTGSVVRKYRAMINDCNWYQAYGEPDFVFQENPGDAFQEKNRMLFERLVFSYNAAPKVLTQYERYAWVSDVDEYARITFDRNLRFMSETEYNLTPREEEMVSCDPEVIFDPGCSVILELKCYALHVPLWMVDLIKYFDLRRRSFSKYMTGIAEVIGLYQYDASSRVAAIHL